MDEHGQAGERIGVLVIDDEESVRISLGFHFEDCGFITRSVDSGESAIRMIEEEVPEVVIVDLRLPGMDGIEFIKQASARWPDIHFVIYTGSPAASIPEEVEGRQGVSGRIFFKPLEDMSELSDYVWELVSGS